MFRRLMYVWFLSSGLALICCTASVKAQSHSCQYLAASGWRCGDGEVCCGENTRLCVSTSKLPFRHCSCVYNRDCNYDEYCYGYSCKKSSTVQPSTVKRSYFQLSTLKPFYCDSDSSCLGDNRICQDGRCVMKAHDSSFLDDPGSLAGYITGVVVCILAIIGLIVYYVHTKKRRIPSSMHPPAERMRREATNLDQNTSATEVASPGENEHETQSVTTAVSSVIVVEDENNPPLPPGAPPPYHSLEFHRQQENGNENLLPVQPPPCYEASVREIMI